MTGSRANTAGVPTPACFELCASESVPALGTADDTRNSQRHRELLQTNAEWFCRLRWFVVAGLVSAGVGVLALPDGVPWLQGWSARWTLGAAGVLAAANISYLLLLRRHRNSPRLTHAVWLIWSQILVDLAVLSVVIYFLGCRASYAPFMYLFHIILACIFFQRAQSLIVLGVSAAMYLVCLGIEIAQLGTPAADITRTADGSAVVIGQLGWLLAIWIVIWYLVSWLAAALRERDDELVAAHRQLVASCDERSRHMLQTTHQLKSPFAAIDANAQLLLGGYCGKLDLPALAIVEKISVRCRMLAQQIQDMIQLANLRSQAQASLRAQQTDFADIVRGAIERWQPAAAARGIQWQVDAQSVTVGVVKDYAKMLVDNLIGNAVNYSFDGGVVLVTCAADGLDAVRLEIRDQGIGIPVDKLPHIFEDYYRTQAAVEHNKASTGLGLAIVRDVVTRMNAALRIESSPGWGTRVVVCVPTADPAPHAAARDCCQPDP